MSELPPELHIEVTRIYTNTQKHMDKQQLTLGAEWFDSLHPLHLTPRQITVFPSEGQRDRTATGRGIDCKFTRFLHRVAA